MKLPLFQVDAFSSAAFGGNPAAVVPLGEWLADETMQDIAMENQLSETAFFVPEGDGFRLRWFTPTVEVDLCGHATLATAHVIFAEQGCERDEVLFESRSGPLVVRRTPEGYSMNFPIDRIVPAEQEKSAVEEAVEAPVRELWKGRHDYMAVVEDENTVAGLKPDLRKVGAIEIRGILVTSAGMEADFVSRCFFPRFGIDEDPVTGSAHTTMAPYWAERLGKETLHARQISRRGGELRCTPRGDRIDIAGQAVTFLRGEIEL